MSELLIYGASDDLIEIEGAVRDEFDWSGREGVLVADCTGNVILVWPYFNGDWEVTTEVLSSAVVGPRVTVVARPGWEDDFPQGDKGVKITDLGERVRVLKVEKPFR